MNHSAASTAQTNSTRETERMVREEIFFRPARRAAIFCAIVCVSLLGYAKAASAATFSSGAPISIPEFSNANPYPATIDVTGVTGQVTDVDLRLEDFSHGTIDDVAVALQAPSGHSMMVMNGAGRFAVGPIDLTLDDEASQPLDSEANPATGRYRPMSFYTGDTFPAPGPGADYCMPAPHGTCTLGSFDGLDAVGQWKLFVRDNLGTSSGQIAGGWTLELTTSGPADPVAPETTIDSGPSGDIESRTATFAFSASENARFECSLDGGGFSACSSPASFSSLGLGAHTFAVRAIDPAGNVDATPATRAFRVVEQGQPPRGDTKAPSVAIDKVTVKSRKRLARVRFSASDDRSGPGSLRFECSLDGGPDRPCSSPAVFKRLERGRHTVAVHAADEAGNRSEARTARFKIKRANG